MDCAAKFKEEVAAIPGVARVELNFGTARLTVEGDFDPGAVSREGSRHDIVVWPEGEQNPPQSLWLRHQQVIIGGLSGLTALFGWLASLAGAPRVVVIALYLAAMVIGGSATVRKAWYSLRKFRFDMNVLMTAAVLGAVLIGQWSEGAVVAFLYSVSNALESLTMEKARESINSLMKVAPRVATVRRGGRELLLPVEEIHPEDRVLVKPGERIAVDGRVAKGSSAVDQAAITGESIPVEKVTGDQVYAGTINREGALEIEVTKPADDTTIARIIHLVEEAQTRRAPAQAFVDRFAAVYTPVVLALAAGVALLPPLISGGAWGEWFYRGLALMVVSCPCALVVSTPVALVSAIGNAARHGVLIKGGLHLEAAGSLAAVAFDKTGTLTRGRPVVTDLIPMEEASADRLLAMAAGMERFSEHPLAKAIVAEAEERGLALPAVENFKALAGKGAQGEIAGRRYYIGNVRLFEDIGVLPAGEERIGRLQREGKTAMFLGGEEELLGIIAVADQVRESSGNAVQELQQMGIRTAMLTGDNSATAGAIAREIGIDEFEAGLLPENKVEAVQKLLRKYGRVAMVGDGINDAPALAVATVGIAMGGAGTDVALETADLALMADDLSKLPFSIRLSRAALGVIKQNIGFALVVKLIAVLLVFPGWLTLWLAILADMGASVLVTLNGIRLLRIRP